MYSQPPIGWNYMQPVDPRLEEKRRLRRDGAFIGAIMLGLYLGMQFSFTALALLASVLGIIDPSQLHSPYLGLSHEAYMVFYGFVYVTSCLLPVVIVAACFKRKFKPAIPAAGFPASAGFLGVLSGFGICTLGNVLSSFFVKFLHSLGVPYPHVPSMMEPTLSSLGLNLVVLAVLPAFIEELIFRGCILRTLRPYGDGFAVVASALLFGIVHANLMQTPFAAIASLGMGWLYVATNNLWLPIAVHLVNNITALLFEFMMFDGSYRYGLYSDAVITAVSLVIGLIAYLIMREKHPEMYHFRKVPGYLRTGEKLDAFFLSPLMIAAIILLFILMMTRLL